MKWGKVSRNVCLTGDGALYYRNLVLCEDSCEEMQLQNIDFRHLILTRFLLLFSRVAVSLP